MPKFIHCFEKVSLIYYIKLFCLFIFTLIAFCLFIFYPVCYPQFSLPFISDNIFKNCEDMTNNWNCPSNRIMYCQPQAKAKAKAMPGRLYICLFDLLSIIMTYEHTLFTNIKGGSSRWISTIVMGVKNKTRAQTLNDTSNWKETVFRIVVHFKISQKLSNIYNG